jgi:hypothetical protein
MEVCSEKRIGKSGKIAFFMSTQVAFFSHRRDDNSNYCTPGRTRGSCEGELLYAWAVRQGKEEHVN